MTYVSLEELRKVPITQVVGLGSRCAVAYNIRRFYNIGTAMPFDWWITPTGSLAKILPDIDVDKIYEPSQLYMSRHPSIIHRVYDVMLHHEFPRHMTEPGHPIVDDFLDHIEQPKVRTKYLFGRFLAMNQSSERILFIRQEEIQDNEVSALSNLFNDAVWSYAIIPAFQADGFDWRSDPVQWDAALGSLDITLDRSCHKPFTMRGAEHHKDDLLPVKP